MLALALGVSWDFSFFFSSISISSSYSQKDISHFSSLSNLRNDLKNFPCFLFPHKKTDFFHLPSLVPFIIKFPPWCTCVLFSKIYILRTLCFPSILLFANKPTATWFYSQFFFRFYAPHFEYFFLRNFQNFFNKISSKIALTCMKKRLMLSSTEQDGRKFRTLQHILHEISNFPPYDPSLLLW